MTSIEVRRVLGRLGNERGAHAERVVVDALNSCWRPKWVKGARLASKELDHKGVDVVVSTDVGDLYLQVKASKREVQRRRAEYEAKSIAIVWARPLDSIDVVCTRAAGELARLRSKIIDKFTCHL